jgi:amino acid transporter
MKMQRSIGLIGLTFVAISGMIGSGWLFGPLFAAQLAGPAAIVSWVLAGFGMLLIALTYAEISAMFPVAGGLARLPHFSHGNVVSMSIGWAAWIGYVSAAPLEVQGLLEYASNEPHLAWLFQDAPGRSGDNRLTLFGGVAASGMLLIFTVINAFGVRFVAAINTSVTWVKLFVPILAAITLLSLHFDADNLTAFGGFAPNGVQGILAATASGGVIFAFIGFRHAIDMAGEAHNPQVTVPLSLTLAVIVCIAIYLLVQVAFIGALSPAHLENGWHALSFGQSNGPMAALVTSFGVTWLVIVLYADAILGPASAGLVSTASTGRLAMAMSQNGLFPRGLAVLSPRGVPLRALILNFLVGLLIFLPITSWKEIITFSTGTIVLSFCMGPLSLVALRSQLPDQPRAFRIPFAWPLAALAFVVVCFVIYWTGWETLWRIALPMAVGLAWFSFTLVRDADLRRSLDLREAFWLVPYFLGLLALTYLGSFEGGIGWLTFGWDLLAVAVFSLAIFYLAYLCRLPREKVLRYLDEEAGFEWTEYKEDDKSL